MKKASTLHTFFGPAIKGPAPIIIDKKTEKKEEEEMDDVMIGLDDDDQELMDDDIGSDEDYDDEDYMDENDDTIDLASEDDASTSGVNNKTVGPQLTASSSAPRKHRKFEAKEISVMEAQFKLTPKLLPTDRRRLSLELGLEEKRIMDWFGNRQRAEKNKKNPKPKAPRKRRVDFNLPQLKALNDAYKLKKYPSAEEKTAISKAAGLDIKQVENWFNKKRRNDTNIILIPPTVTPIIPSPNKDPQVFSNVGRSRRPYKSEDVKDASIWNVYQAKYKDANGHPVQTVYGITTLLNPAQAALHNWQNVLLAIAKIKAAVNKKEMDAAETELIEIMNKCGLYCSYRREVMEQGLSAMPETAVSTGLYATDKTTAKALQFDRRLRTLSLGTLMPHECIEDLKESSQYLEDVTQLFKPDLAPYNQRWIDFSSDAMDDYLNGDGCHPGIDQKLIQRFKCKEEYQFDPAKISDRVLKIIMDEQQQQLSAMDE